MKRARKIWPRAVVLLKALTGLVLGGFIIFLSTVVIFESEGDKNHCAEVLGQPVIKVDSAPIDPKNNLQVIHVSGLATSSEVLKDPLLKVSQQAIKILRKVEVYQWTEQTKDNKKFNYTPVWSESLIDSRQFHDPQAHSNPNKMIVNAFQQQARTVRLGDFYLPPDMVEEIKGPIMLDLAQVNTQPLEEKFNKTVLHTDHALYIGNDPQKPEIGDIKISVMEVMPQTLSVIGQQVGNRIHTYKAASGERISFLVMGNHSAEQMLKEAEPVNKKLRAVIRLGSLVMMVVGMYLLLWPVAALSGMVPYLGVLVKHDRGYIAFIGGLLIWAITTGVAWYSYRSFWTLGIILIALLVSCIMLAIRSSSLD